MDPRDLDILFPSEDYLKQYATRVARHTGQPEPTIVSERFPGGFEWHKAQHEVGGFLVDAVYIASGGGIPDSTTGEGVWEGGPFAWSFARQVRFQEFTVLVVPLEIQLESQLRRGCQDRATAIASALCATGYDPVLLKQCLSREHLDTWAEAIKLHAVRQTDYPVR